MGMNVITLGTLIEFWNVHPTAEPPLRDWYKHMKANEYSSFAEIRESFGSADWVEGYIVFNIGGNKFRLIMKPNFAFKSFFVKHVFTHEEYNGWAP